MADVKRWYIYAVSALTLNAVAWAVISLVRELLIRQVRTPIGFLALMLAIIIVGLPIYLVHWLWAQRNAEADLEDRASIPRVIFLYVMMTVFMAPIIVSGFAVLKSILHLLFDVRLTGYGIRPPTENLVYHMTSLVILSVLWFYHWRVRSGDEKVLPKSEAAIVVRQIYIYVFAGVGLVLTALGVFNLIHVLMVMAAAGPTPVDFGRPFLTDVIANIAVGLSVWLSHWLLAQRLFQGSDENEQESIVRKIYLYLVILFSVLTVVTVLTTILTDLLERLFNVPTSGGDVRQAIAIIVAGGAIWLYHAYVLRQDAAQARGMMQQTTVRRVYLYLVAAIGLGVVLVGIAGEISVFIRSLGGSGLILSLREQLAVFTAMLIAGVPVWLLNWRQIQISAADPGEHGQEERASLIRRIYLYFYIFVATATVLSSSVYVVWQIIQLALGERADTDLAINLGQAVGYFIVAVAVWIYHGSILRREGAILKQEVASKQIAVRVAVIDDDDGSLGAALVNQIKAKVPSALVQLLPLGSAAKEAVNGDGPKESPVQILADAEVIVGPWHMAVTGSAGGLVTESIVQTITSSPAQKVLIPVRKEGWSWTGVERWKVQDIVKEAAGAVEQLAAGNQLQERRKLSPVVIIIAVLIGLCLIGSIVPGLIALFVDSLMY